MKRIGIVLLTLSLCLGLSSCGSYDNPSTEDEYLNGIEQGRQEMFMDLWMSSSDVAYLYLGDSWETDHFVLKLDIIHKALDSISSYNDSTDFVEFDLTMKETTIEECVMSDSMLFNIYSVRDGEWNAVLGYDNYYDYSALNQLSGNHGVGHIQLYGDVQFLIAIVVIDSCIYTARYYCDT